MDNTKSVYQNYQIEHNGKLYDLKHENGKYSFTFIPTSPDDTITLYNSTMVSRDYIADDHVTNIQIEENDVGTGYVSSASKKTMFADMIDALEALEYDITSEDGTVKTYVRQEAGKVENKIIDTETGLINRRLVTPGYVLNRLENANKNKFAEIIQSNDVVQANMNNSMKTTISDELFEVAYDKIAERRNFIPNSSFTVADYTEEKYPFYITYYKVPPTVENLSKEQYYSESRKGMSHLWSDMSNMGLYVTAPKITMKLTDKLPNNKEAYLKLSVFSAEYDDEKGYSVYGERQNRLKFTLGSRTTGWIGSNRELKITFEAKSGDTGSSDELVIELEKKGEYIIKPETLTLSDTPYFFKWGAKHTLAEDYIEPSKFSLGKDGIAIKSDLIHISGDTHIDNAFITKLMVEDMEAHHVTAHTAKFGTVIANNIDVNEISGNKAKFLELLLDGVNSIMKLDGDALGIVRKDGSLSLKLDEQGFNVVNKNGKKVGSIGHKFPYKEEIGENGQVVYSPDPYGQESMTIGVNRGFRGGLGYQTNSREEHRYTSVLTIDGTTGEIMLPSQVKFSSGAKLEFGHGTYNNLNQDYFYIKDTKTGNGIAVDSGGLRYWNGRVWQRV